MATSPSILETSHWISYSPFKVSEDELKTYVNLQHHFIHVFAETFFEMASFLSRTMLHCLAYVIEPCPGENKGSADKFIQRTVRKTALRILYMSSALVMFVIPALGFLPFIAICPKPFFILIRCARFCLKDIVKISIYYNIFIFSAILPFYFMSHYLKRGLRYSTSNACVNDQNCNTLHLRTFNTGLSGETARILADLRPNEQRVHEIGLWMIDTQNTADVLCLQNIFDKKSEEQLLKYLHHRYPHIIWDITPHVSGTGMMIASKYPIKEFAFMPFNEGSSLEKLSSYGVAKVKVQKNGKTFDIYTTQFQQSAIRIKQIQQIYKWMVKDPTDISIFCGDMNICPFNVLKKKDNDEQLAQKIPNQWEDLTLSTKKDSSNATDGSLYYMDSWKVKMQTFYAKYISNHIPATNNEQSQELQQGCNYWGTPEWSSHQQTTHTISDRFYMQKKHLTQFTNIETKILHMTMSLNMQSAPSNHLPVDLVLHWE